ncbi:MAG: DEAD/DEAH box helicase, partial [Opitutales bacterium]|nr:DEAD/DEAH box helicase [Opitutales bacterium]
MNFIGKILTLGGLLKFGRKKKSKAGRKTRFSSERRGVKQPKKSKVDDSFERRRGGRRQGGARKKNEGAAACEKPARAPKEVPQIENLQSLKDDVKKFSDLGLGDRTLAAIRKMGFSEPTEIQTRAIPVALSGRDIIG